MKITVDQLHHIAGAPINVDVATGVAQFLPVVFAEYQINTVLRVAHFLAQAAHECDHFRTLTEYASGAEYEGRHDLGNTCAGDGRKFRGRGIFQITGRYNYEKFGKLIEVDLCGDPRTASDPENSCWTAGAFWDSRKLNMYADKDDIVSITHRINGGENGLEDRRQMLGRAKIIVPDMLKG